MNYRNFYISLLLAFLICVGIFKSVYSQTSSTLNSKSSIDAVIINSPTTTLVTSTIKTKEIKLQFLITPEEIVRAGFTKVEEIKPQIGENKFLLPVQYFKVGESILLEKTKQDCEECGNLLVVYITPQIRTTTPKWAVNTNPEVNKMGNRVQIKMLVGQRVIFVTTPEEESGMRLISALRERVFLSRTLLRDIPKDEEEDDD